MKVLDKKIIFRELDCSSAEEVIRYMGNAMKKEGYVREGYVEAVIEREKVFPTGLPGVSMSIAIPHTNPEYVNEAAVAVAIPKKEVTFSMMCDADKKLECSIIMLLAIKDPNMQIELLKKLMGVIQNEQMLKEIKNAENVDQIMDILSVLETD